MNQVPKGLDYQGRHPEAAHPATEVGQDDMPEAMGRAAAAVMLVVIAFLLAAALAFLMP